MGLQSDDQQAYQTVRLPVAALRGHCIKAEWLYSIQRYRPKGRLSAIASRERSKEYLTIVTHKGYYRYKRLPFGVNFAPALFQECMDKVLSGLGRSIAYLDDRIWGSVSSDL